MKNSHGRESWKSVIHRGDIKDLEGFEVYKWGFSSGCTKGLIQCVNYKSTKEVDFDNQYTILVKSNDDSSRPFSSNGDSGSMVCYDDPNTETIYIVSLVIGVLTEELSKNFIVTFHLNKNLQELTKNTELEFELYDD